MAETCTWLLAHLTPMAFLFTVILLSHSWFCLISLTSLHWGFPALPPWPFCLFCHPHTLGDFIQFLSFKYHLRVDSSQVDISGAELSLDSQQAQPVCLHVGSYPTYLTYLKFIPWQCPKLTPSPLPLMTAPPFPFLRPIKCGSLHRLPFLPHPISILSTNILVPASRHLALEIFTFWTTPQSSLVWIITSHLDPL